ncbi:IclR family transcriptional regulator [Burkholderia cenocepacia]|uniref:IclR family transcriptional regulator n=1 Tax=Burkholderia cenocepacia TaxID=95486 RepID=UPI001BA0B1CD|nr:IclR family transcriptional regulator [Burkholderia cenocepacia]MBR8030143.1 IclR family transcriptional regulator [Burkholderia cenocepacia]MBR8174021.1 IclR family transcriptional regulator [Burkholderia cenocepacia]
MDSEDAGGAETVKSADRTLDLFELLARWGREMSHTEIAEELEIPKSSLTKLLKNLAARDYIRYVPSSKGYRLGDAVTKLAQQAVQLRDLVTCAEPIIQEITQRTKESCALNQLKGDQVEVVATAISRQRLVSHLRRGDLAPLYAVSGGKAILAFLPEAMRAEYLQRVKFERITAHTITTKKALVAELDEVRRLGVAYSMQEYTPGIVGVAVPIISNAGFPLGSLNLAVPSVRYTDEVSPKLVAVLQSAADQVRRQYQTA